MVFSVNALNGVSCEERNYNDGSQGEQMLECLIQDLTIQYFSGGKGPRLNCTLRKYSFEEVGQKMLSLANNSKRIVTEPKPWKDQFCSPMCYHCYSGGKCSDCKQCKKGDKSKKCKKCRAKNCISYSKKDRCEICWEKEKKAKILDL